MGNIEVVQSRIRLSGSLGTPMCPRCGKHMKPEDINYDGLRGHRSSVRLWCTACYCWYHSNRVCISKFGIDLAEKRRRYEEQDCCCAVCRHFLTFERHSPNQRPPGTRRGASFMVGKKLNTEKANPYYAVLDHKRGPNNTRRRVSKRGHISAVRLFQEGDMLRAILCHLCNISVSQLEEYGHQFVHPAIHEYLDYWNEEFRLFTASNPVLRQTALFFDDLETLAEAA